MPNRLVAAWLPPALRSALNRMIGAQITYRGPFATWNEALASSTGYDQDAILARVINATQRVLRGAARYEQDGIAFAFEPPSSHALPGLLLAATRDQGRLSVLDFGGGLGSHYLRWRPLLEHVSTMHWAVVEQAAFVSAGCNLFAANPSISFYQGVSQIPSQPNTVLASGVLQFLPDPHATLHELVMLRPQTIVLDRTPFGNKEAVVTQHVPASLGRASYPLWVLSRDRIHGLLDEAYDLIAEFDAPDQPLRAPGISATYRGSIWMRQS